MVPVSVLGQGSVALEGIMYYGLNQSEKGLSIEVRRIYNEIKRSQKAGSIAASVGLRVARQRETESSWETFLHNVVPRFRGAPKSPRYEPELGNSID